jgi:hypothetical protein
MALVLFKLDQGVRLPRHTVGFLVALPASVLWAVARIQLGTSFNSTR